MQFNKSEIRLDRCFVEALDRLEQDPFGVGSAFPAIQLDPLAFLQIFVVLEEMPDAFQPMRRNMVDGMDVRIDVEHMVDRYRHDLFIGFRELRLRDKTSPHSTIGIATAFTTSGTRGVAIGARLNFGENRYQTAFAIGKGRANYTFFGIGRIPGREPLSADIRQEGGIFFGEFLRNVGKSVFVGPRYQYRNSTYHWADYQPLAVSKCPR